MRPQRVAVVSSRPQLVAEVSRLCAMAGQPVEVAEPGPEVARACRSSALIVVDDDSVQAVEAATGPDRPDVVIVTDDADRVETWQAAVRLGASRVVTLPGGAAELLDLLALVGEQPGSPGPLVGVIGGRGGAGASTLAVALGWAFARRDAAVMLVDLDQSGGGLDLALGVEHVPGLRWPDLYDANGVVASLALREQLPSLDGMTILSTGSRLRGRESPMHSLPDRRAVSSVIDAGRRGGGVVVADLPRGSAESVDAVVAACTVLLLVVPAEVRAVAAATSVGRRVQSLCADVRTVVRLDQRCRLRERDVVNALGFAHAATVRTESGVTAAIDRAQLPAWLRRARMGRTARSLAGVILTSGSGAAS
ncbi:MAG TPA: septum site-determining protein Ssd [Mycobacteriales bacterium]|nr:septum site-determining protein Ssd [Mycobacteriales bacterium]